MARVHGVRGVPGWTTITEIVPLWLVMLLLPVDCDVELLVCEGSFVPDPVEPELIAVFAADGFSDSAVAAAVDPSELFSSAGASDSPTTAFATTSPSGAAATDASTA